MNVHPWLQPGPSLAIAGNSSNTVLLVLFQKKKKKTKYMFFKKNTKEELLQEVSLDERPLGKLWEEGCASEHMVLDPVPQHNCFLYCMLGQQPWLTWTQTQGSVTRINGLGM